MFFSAATCCAEHLGLNSAMIFTFNFMAIVPLASAAAASVVRMEMDFVWDMGPEMGVPPRYHPF